MINFSYSFPLPFSGDPFGTAVFVNQVGNFSGTLMPARRTRTVFVSAIVLLCLCAIATYVSFFYFRTSERWVSHTQEVRGSVGDVEAIASRAARARLNYLLSGDEAELTEYRAAVSQIPGRMRHVRELAKDNPVE